VAKTLGYWPRFTWLYHHRDLVKGLRFVQEPKVLRFFFGRLEALADWGARADCPDPFQYRDYSTYRDTRVYAIHYI